MAAFLFFGRQSFHLLGAWGSAFALVSAEHMVLFKYDLEESGGMETVYFLGLRWMVILWAKF